MAASGHCARVTDVPVEQRPMEPLKVIFKGFEKQPLPTFMEAMKTVEEATKDEAIGEAAERTHLIAREAKSPGAHLNKHRLSVDALAAIMQYTSQEPPMYADLNKKCYNPDRSQAKPYAKYIWRLLDALSQLEAVPNVTVYRGVAGDLSAQYPKGREFTWQSFSSCTKTLGVLADPQFLGQRGKRTMFLIELTQSQARDITQFSLFPSEDEVLIPPGCRFEVLSVLPSDDLVQIQLREQPSPFWIIDLSKPGRGPSPEELFALAEQNLFGDEKDEYLVPLTAAADRGHAGAQRMLGWFLLFEPDDKEATPDVEKGRSLLQAAADQGDAQAMCYLSVLHSTGLRLPPDAAKAADYAKRSAALGHPGGAFALALCYAVGLGVPQDCAQALLWLERAAEGSSAATVVLAGCHALGFGVPWDLKKAVECLKRASEGGSPLCTLALACCHTVGLHVPLDHEVAGELLDRLTEMFPGERPAETFVAKQMMLLGVPAKSHWRVCCRGLAKLAADAGSPWGHAMLIWILDKPCAEDQPAAESSDQGKFEKKELETMEKLAAASNSSWLQLLFGMALAKHVVDAASAALCLAALELALSQGNVWAGLVAAAAAGSEGEKCKIPADLPRALGNLQRVAELGNALGPALLAAFHAAGVLVPRDTKAGVGCMKQAVQQGWYGAEDFFYTVLQGLLEEPEESRGQSGAARVESICDLCIVAVAHIVGESMMKRIAEHPFVVFFFSSKSDQEQ